MLITRVETFLVTPRWLFCRIETDDGVVGWGEPVVEGRAARVRAAVAELAQVLVGTDPLRIEDHWQVMTRAGFYRGGPVLSSAVAGLDQALWDIAGKVRQAPVHELLGGPVRDRIRMYSWVGGDEPAELVEDRLAGVQRVGRTEAGHVHRQRPPPGAAQAVQQQAPGVRAVGVAVQQQQRRAVALQLQRPGAVSRQLERILEERLHEASLGPLPAERHRRDRRHRPARRRMRRLAVCSR